MKLLTSLEGKRGFTLIEILVVIVIISVLATLLMVKFVGVRARGRDTTRTSDLRQLQVALELYRSDVGTYPATLSTCGAGSSLLSGGTTYMSKIPCDPLGTSMGYNGGVYYYVSPSGNATYTLGACIENTNDPDVTATSPGGAGSCPSARYFVLTNP